MLSSNSKRNRTFHYLQVLNKLDHSDLITIIWLRIKTTYIKLDWLIFWCIIRWLARQEVVRGRRDKNTPVQSPSARSARCCCTKSIAIEEEKLEFQCLFILACSMRKALALTKRNSMHKLVLIASKGFFKSNTYPEMQRQ